MKKNNLETSGFWLQPAAVFSGLVVVFGLLLLLSLGLAVVVHLSSWQAPHRLLRFLAHLAVFLGAGWAGKKCIRRAWIHGILVGLVAFVLLGLLGSADHALGSWLWWQRLISVLLTAMLGGMMGGLFKRA